MSLDGILFDLFVTGPSAEAERRDALVRLIEQYALDLSCADAFMDGSRVLLRPGLDPEAAQIAAAAVQSMGLRVEIEPHDADALPPPPARAKPSPAKISPPPKPAAKPSPKPAAPIARPASTPAAPPTKPAALSVASPPKAATAEKPSHSSPSNFLFDVSAGLVGLDGESDAPPSFEERPVTPVDSFGGLFSTTLRDEDEPLSGVDLPRRGPPPPPVMTPDPVRPDSPARAGAPPGASGTLDDRFRPSGADSGAMQIEVDRPARDPMRSTPPPIDKETFAVPRCPTHDVPKHNGRCIRCDAEEADLAGRLFSGRMRRQPMVRIAIGLAAGVFVGWIISAPMARRAESQVAYIREEARREHTRPLEEAQAHAAALDAQADEQSQNAFTRTFGIWAAITAAITALWMRLT